MPDSSLIGRLHSMRQFYNSGQTRPYQFRKQQLQKLRSAIFRMKEDLHDALHTDLKKNAEESWITETGVPVQRDQFHPKKFTSMDATGKGKNKPCKFSFIKLYNERAIGSRAYHRPMELSPATFV